MAVLAPRSVLMGLVTSLFLAWLMQQMVPVFHLPAIQNHDTFPTSTTLSLSESMAQVVKNSLRAARHRAWVGGGYKSTSSLRAPTPIPTPAFHNSATFSTTPHIMSSQKSFMDAVKERRTYYQLNKESPISDKQIAEIAEKALLHVPSSFNSQSTRLVVLLNKDHEKFWDFVLEVLKPLTPEDQFPKTEQKVKGFGAAKGTVSAHLVFVGRHLKHICRFCATRTLNPSRASAKLSVSNPEHVSPAHAYIHRSSLRPPLR